MSKRPILLGLGSALLPSIGCKTIWVTTGFESHPSSDCGKRCSHGKVDRSLSESGPFVHLRIRALNKT